MEDMDLREAASGRHIASGFRGQRTVVVPRPIVAQALRQPITRRLLVTDVGYFPTARDHRRGRAHGIPEFVLLVCASGAGWVRAGAETHRIEAGQLAVIPRHTPHEYGADDRSPWTLWWMHVTGSDSVDLAEGLALAPGRPVPRIRELEKSIAALDAIIGELEHDHSRARLLASSGLAWRLLALLAADQLLPAPGDPLLRAMDYLQERVEAQITVPDLASLVGLSASHLTTLFRRATGGGILAYQTGLRMTRARQLLDTTTTPVAEIARTVGYSDPFYFSRQFRRAHGMSPSHYRYRDQETIDG